MDPDDTQNTNSNSDNNGASNSSKPLDTKDILNRIDNSVPDTTPDPLKVPDIPSVPRTQPINTGDVLEDNNKPDASQNKKEKTKSELAQEKRFSFTRLNDEPVPVSKIDIEENKKEVDENEERPEEKETSTAGLRELEKDEADIFVDPTEKALQNRLKLNRPEDSNKKDEKLKLVKGRTRIDKLDKEASRAVYEADKLKGDKESSEEETEEDKKKKVKRRRLKLVGGGRSFEPTRIIPSMPTTSGGVSMGGVADDKINKQQPGPLITKKKLDELRAKRAELEKKQKEDAAQKEKEAAQKLIEKGDNSGNGSNQTTPPASPPVSPQNLSQNSAPASTQLTTGNMPESVNAQARPNANLRQALNVTKAPAAVRGAFNSFVKLSMRFAGPILGAAAPVIIGIVCVVAIIGSITALFMSIASLAATADVTEASNTTGQARAFFKIYDVDAQLNDTANHGNPIVVEVTSDAAGNQYLKSINFAVSYQLNSVDVYNEKYLGKNSPYYVQVEDASIQFQLVGIPQDILDQATPFLSMPGMPSNLYPTVGYNENLYLWQPLICADNGLLSQLKSNGYQNKYCATYPQLPEKAYFTFEWPDNTIDVTNFTQQVYIQSNPKVTLGNYLKDGKKYLGPYDLTDPQGFRACLSIYGSNPGFVDCADNIEAAAAIAGAPKVTGNVDGEIASGCPFAYYRSKGEKLQCTAGFNYTVSETNGKHNANDVTVYDSTNSKLTDRSILSPVKGKVIATNSDLPGYFNQCGLYLQIQDASDSTTSYMIAHLDWKVWGDVLPTVGDEIQLDQNLGPAFNPPTPGSRSYGKWDPCWTGEHVHFAIYKNGQPIDPKPYIAQKCNQLDYTCPER